MGVLPGKFSLGILASGHQKPEAIVIVYTLYMLTGCVLNAVGIEFPAPIVGLVCANFKVLFYIQEIHVLEVFAASVPVGF